MLNLSELQVKKIKQAAGYRGRNVKFKEFQPGMSLNSYWDSGSRDYFYFVNVLTGAVRAVGQNGTPFDGVNLKTTVLNPNEVLAERTVMRGKDVALYIFS
jgi:hypothetical protein